jgi:anaerobic selenocysteine-containing dehydrogenase
LGPVCEVPEEAIEALGIEDGAVVEIYADNR